MKKILIAIIITLPLSLAAQVTFIIDSLPAYTPPEDDLFIAGNFNGWNPGNTDYRLARNSQDHWEITLLSQPQGTQIQYKFTRGSWETVEKGPNGEEIDNRLFTYGNGDTVRIIIHNWRQNGGGGSTAADNVIVMDEDFHMPQLGRTRRIWLYLPPDYEISGKRYPVLYMHDGQNLFDASTSFAGEWEVDETLNGLFQQGKEVPIIVGIDNGGEYRIAEYTPWPHTIYGGGEGDLYMQFIIQTLKPYIDGNFRTMPDREYTGIMGSSLGGLISHYGALAYPDVFSKAGVFSPSFWWSAQVWPFTAAAGHQDAMKIYMMCGGAEGQGTINNMLNMQDTLLAHGFMPGEMNVKVIPGGQHNENLWRQDFEEAYLWLFGSFANQVAVPHNRQIIRLFPNPAGDRVSFPADFPQEYDTVEVIDVAGKTILSKSPFTGNTLNISGFSHGIYVISLVSAGKLYQGKFIKE